ncbi:unnamed protein product [Candidula unifasciata]|uniref:E3 ubiquitin-protein ligase RNF34 n=1 Tax=Candidula unifasciata TaxID=100452 RepID=A0A8S3YN35_9EUPU|nr:unnamed protein product [Candidula unifasciata]
MGAGAVSGHSQGTAGGTQNQENQFRNSDNLRRTSQTTLPTARSDVRKHSLPTLQMKMSCDRCSVNFSLFKRKKYCQECHRYFCSTCLPKPNSSSTVGRQCSKCRLLMSGHFSRDDLLTWKVNDMKCFLNVRNISTKDCREKHDLVELVLARFCTLSRQSIQDQEEHEILVRQMAAHVRDISSVSVSSSSGTSNNNSPLSQKSSQARPLSRQPDTSEATGDNLASTSSLASTAPPTNPLPSPPGEPRTDSSAAGSSGVWSETTASHRVPEEPQGIHFELNNDNLQEFLESMERIQELIRQHDTSGQDEPTEQPIRRMQLDDITEISHIDALSVRQLKELLVNNFVDYRGCCEKAELIQKTKRLWKDHQENKIRAQRIHNLEESAFETHKTNEPKEIVSTVIVQEELVVLSAAATTPESGTADEEETQTHNLPTGDDDTAEASTASSKTEMPAAEATTKGTKTTEPTTASSRELNEQRNDSLCHICMDTLIDCILLECGHMVTCTQCGKRLADCPVCRQYIVRVVRVFRS